MLPSSQRDVLLVTVIGGHSPLVVCKAAYANFPVGEGRIARMLA